MSNYISKNRCKYYLKIHLILVCKYRKTLLQGDLDINMKKILTDIQEISDFTIDIMETDLDHIHFLISYPPNLSVSSIVNRLKSISTNRIWKLHYLYLKKQFWQEKTFWSDGYFVCSIGEASPNTIKHYIANQG